MSETIINNSRELSEMLSEKEKEAIEELKKQYRLSTNVDCITTDIRNEYAKTILNLIEKLQKEIEKYKEEIEYKNDIIKGQNKKYNQTKKTLKGQLEKKDKIINLMAERIKDFEFLLSIEEIKEIFTKKLEE